eukprot:g187.t1
MLLLKSCRITNTTAIILITIIPMYFAIPSLDANTSLERDSPIEKIDSSMNISSFPPAWKDVLRIGKKKFPVINLADILFDQLKKSRNVSEEIVCTDDTCRAEEGKEEESDSSNNFDSDNYFLSEIKKSKVKLLQKKTDEKMKQEKKRLERMKRYKLGLEEGWRRYQNEISKSIPFFNEKLL